MKELADLFLSFCRIGGFTFGGGYAMLPMIQKEIVEQRKWATEEEVMDYFAIGQCTPGVIAVNTATFIGYKRKGVLGGIVATAGVIFPSIIIVTIIAAFLNNFAEIAVLKNTKAIFHCPKAPPPYASPDRPVHRAPYTPLPYIFCRGRH